MIYRRFQDFYHKQKKGILVVLFFLLITFFNFKQVSSTTTAFEPGPFITPQLTIVPVTFIPVTLTPFQITPGPTLTINPPITGIIPPSPTWVPLTWVPLPSTTWIPLTWVPLPSTTSFPITPIQVTLVPTRTPTTTPSSTPYPTLPIYHFPVITTTSLPKGSLFKNYSASVSGYDEDMNDNLNMKITDLPPGLSQNLCLNWKDALNRKIIIRCMISGKPIKMGSYNVKVDLYDGRTGQVKILRLTIGLR